MVADGVQTGRSTGGGWSRPEVSWPGFRSHRISRTVTANAEHDALILPRIAEGDPSAVSDCIDRYSGLVWSLARRLCPNTTEAEDAVQDVFISVWRSAKRFDPSMGSEPTFVAMIARRRLIDRVRRATRGPDMVALEERAVSGSTAGGSLGSGSGVSGVQNGIGAESDRFSTSEESAIAQRAIGELSEDQQRVLRLSVVHGLSHERIAHSTGLPLGTVKTHIRRGLIKVRKLLAERAARASRAAGSVPGNGAPEADERGR